MYLRSTILSFLFVFTISHIAGCSSKSAPAVEKISESQTAAPPPSVPRYFFAEIHVLAETSPEGVCNEGNRMASNSINPWEVEINERKKIVSKNLFKKFAVNLDLELIGFDTGKYQVTSLDGALPAVVPFQIRMRKLPGAVIELAYLDQVIQVKMMGAPVYTFSAVETRGDCTINHNVNIFTDRAGLFEVE